MRRMRPDLLTRCAEFARFFSRTERCPHILPVHEWQVLKPVFVPKARRETAVESAKQAKEEKEREQKRNIEKVTFPGVGACVAG